MIGRGWDGTVETIETRGGGGVGCKGKESGKDAGTGLKRGG